MRVLLLGPTENEKIPQALRREHILCDRIDAAACDPGALPAGVYDACLLVACAADKGAGAQLARQLTQLRKKGLSLPLLAVCPHLPARDRILVLDAGADDVLSAPFLMGELLARVRAVSRRGPLLQPSLLAAGDLTLDRSTCMLHSQGGEIRLSGKELQLLELFLLHPGKVLPRAVLQQKVWGLGSTSAYNNIEVYLSLVRRRLRAVGSSAQIHAERGVGYYLDV